MLPTPEGISEDVWSAVRSVRLWSAASDEALEWLSRTATIAEFAKDETLYRQGQTPESVAVMLNGHARASTTMDGHSVVVEIYWPGDVVGAIAALAGIGFEADIAAAVPLRAAMIPVGAVKDLLKSEPAVAMSVIDDLAQRWLAAINFAKRGALDVTQRVAEYLCDLPHTDLGDDAYSVEIPVARVELAALLGTTPETLSRTFHALADEGVIEAHDRMIIVLKAQELLRANTASATTVGKHQRSHRD